MKDLDYSGKQSFRRDRELSEILPPVKKSVAIGMATIDSDVAKRLFTNIAKTYLKGNVLKSGLSKMDQKQYIPISDDADQVASAAFRYAKNSTDSGKIIPFSVYQSCIDDLVNRQWQARRIYDSFLNDENIPKDIVTSSITESRYKKDSEIVNYIKEYFEGNGVAGMLLTALSIAPFQNLGFQALGVENGTKAYFSAQVPIGIAVLLELGIKAERIYKLLKDSGNSTNEVEDILDDLANNEESRRKVFSSINMDYDEFKKSQTTSDAEIILNYCNQYISSYVPKGLETYDHWVAYGSVASRQNILRSMLDTATDYSIEFADLTQTNLPTTNSTGGTISEELSRNPQLKINNLIGSYYNEIESTANNDYNNIVNSFMYQVADEDICCLVEIFGSLNTEILTTISQVLKILSLEFQGEIVRLQDAFYKLVSDISMAAVFEIITKLSKLSDKIISKINKSLIENIKMFDNCPSILDISASLSLTFDNINQKINEFLIKLLNYTDRLGHPHSIGWKITADKRYILTIARILEVIAQKLEAAEVCNRKNLSERQYDIVLQDAKDQASMEIIHTIIDKSPPSIQITDEEIKKYFPDLEPDTSPTYGFKYGPKTIFPDLSRRNSSGEKTGCAFGNLNEDNIEELKSTLNNNLKKSFSSDD